MLVGALALLFTACQKDETFSSEEFGGEINISAMIRSFVDTETRAQLNTSGGGKIEFAANDQIALYITPEGGQTVRHTATFNGSKWSVDGGLKWTAFDAAKVTFAAYYPAITTEVGGAFDLSAETNQTFSGMDTRSDKLLAAKAVVTKGNNVSLRFKHVMHLMEVNLKAESGQNGFSESELNKFQIYAKVFNKVSIDPVTGELSEPMGERVEIKMGNNNTKAFRAVICPQPVVGEMQEVGLLRLVSGATEKWYKAPVTLNSGEYFEQFESGTKMTFNLVIGRKGQVTEDLTNKTIWAAGINNPSQTTWGLAYPSLGTLGLTYDPSYGWYDIKKKDATSPTYDDSNMCWAASATNILHWWLDRNAENIRCYNEYKRSLDPSFKPALSYYDKTDPLHRTSDIFDFFKNTCTNLGGWIYKGVDWYLRGTPVTGHSEIENNPITNGHKARGGFFGDVLAAGSEAPYVIGGARDAGEFIKRHLRAGDGIGICHQVFSGSHAITLWGASYDDNGKITTVYVCDNNHGESELLHGNGAMTPGRESAFSLYQLRIGEQEPGSNVYYLESSSKGTYGVTITGLEAFPQCKASWEAFWANPDHAAFAPKK